MKKHLSIAFLYLSMFFNNCDCMNFNSGKQSKFSRVNGFYDKESQNKANIYKFSESVDNHGKAKEKLNNVLSSIKEKYGATEYDFETSKSIRREFARAFEEVMGDLTKSYEIYNKCISYEKNGDEDTCDDVRVYIEIVKYQENNKQIFDIFNKKQQNIEDQVSQNFVENQKFQSQEQNHVIEFHGQTNNQAGNYNKKKPKSCAYVCFECIVYFLGRCFCIKQDEFDEKNDVSQNQNQNQNQNQMKIQQANYPESNQYQYPPQYQPNDNIYLTKRKSDDKNNNESDGNNESNIIPHKK